MTATCEHHSCQTPANLSSADLRLELRSGSGGRSYFAVMLGCRFLGSIQDSGFKTWNGRWITKWSVFAGGSAVLLPGICDRMGRKIGWHPVEKRMVALEDSLVATVHAFAQWCAHTAFTWRVALH
jgi:hypothetical protein